MSTESSWFEGALEVPSLIILVALILFTSSTYPTQMLMAPASESTGGVYI